jgi:NADH-quinone oxidoreductase subunit C
VPDGEQSVQSLQQRFAGAVVRAGSFRDQHWVELRPDALLAVCGWLRDDPAAGYDSLVDVTAVHWPDDERPIEIVYHLYSYRHDDRLRLKVRLAEGETVPSLAKLWKSAEWNERETYDMFGVRFAGHPDLRRILMPDDYSDHPLRKEFPLFRG